MIKKGSNNLQVRLVQNVLNQFGISVGRPDNIFGAKTELGVKKLQKMFRLSVDGVVGNNTMSLIRRLENIKHFKYSEFACKHCRDVYVDINTLEKLELLRMKVGALRVTSGYRCPTHNKNVGGASKSYHVKGNAVDVKGIKANPRDVQKQADIIFKGNGMGKYNTFTHVDTRGYHSRW